MAATETQGAAPAARRLPAFYRNRHSLAYTVALDILLINLAFVLGYVVRYELQLFRPVLDALKAPYAAYLPSQVLHTLLMLGFLTLDGVYQRRRGGSWFDELYRVTNATTTAVVIQVAITFYFRPLVYSRLLFIEAGLITIVLLSGVRLLQRAVQANLRRRGLGVDRVLIIGAGETGRTVMRNLVALPALGYQVVGFVDDDVSKGDLGRFRALGTLDNLGAVLKGERVDEVIITLPWTNHRTIIGLVRICESLGVRARVVPDMFQMSLTRVDFDDIGGIPLMGLREARISRGGRLVKRALDFTLAALGLALSSPLSLLIALIIKLDSPGPVIFKQARVGERGRLFDIHKFRSMRLGAEEQQAELRSRNEASGPLFKIKDDPRVTRIGPLLRRRSLDEIPQLWNVLRGEMSIVGPRPGLPSEVAQYQPWHRQRLEVPPGITGLWQVSGRSDLSFDEMCLLDIYYIENWSLGMDLTIMLRTVPRVLFGQGAY
jgi:exopolysaccharide biosynthesis polyprenyl glycosylphosphotransferase